MILGFRTVEFQILSSYSEITNSDVCSFNRKDFGCAELSGRTVCGCSLAGITDSNPAGGMAICLL